MISVVICSVNAARYRAATSMYGRLLAGAPHELIGVHDARSLCEGYNRGLEASRGDLVMFSHDDVEFLAPDFGRRVRAYLGVYDLIGVAGTSRLLGPRWAKAGPPWIYGQVAQFARGMPGFEVSIFGAPARHVGGMQAFDGLWFACRREVAASVRFDADTFDHFHLYDLDFTFRCHLAGFRLGVVNDLHAVHASRGGYDAVWQQQADRFTAKHAASLDPMRPRQFLVGGARVADKREAVELMTPPHWALLPDIAAEGA